MMMRESSGSTDSAGTRSATGSTDPTRGTDATGATATSSAAPSLDAIASISHDRIVCRNCPPGTEEEVRRLWATERPRLTRHLKRIPDAHPHFNLVVTPQRVGYEARLTLSLAVGTIAARGQGEPLEHAIGQATTRLENELSRHLSHLRKEEQRRNLRRRRSDLDEAASELAADHARGDRGAFMEALRPYLPRLRDLARHEIRAAQLEGRIIPGDVTVGDLLDELLTRAWANFDRHPDDMPLDTWLVRQLHEIADEMLHSKPRTDLREPLDASRDPHTVSNGEGWVQELEPGWLDQRGIRLEDILAEDETRSDPEQLVETEELQRLVAEALKDSPATQRRAFMLAAFDGWTEEEIAMLLRRNRADVRADIAAAREKVRRRLQDAGALP
jgi:RNA polymerase sigma factor (sigma-70 family)